MTVVNQHGVNWGRACIWMLLTFFSANIYSAEDVNSNSQLTALDVRVVVPREFPPHYLVDETETPIGFAIDILNAVAGYSNLNLNYQIENSWTEVYKVMDSGQADIIPNLGISQRRLVKYNFSIPVEIEPISIFVRKSNSAINSKQDLIGQHVGVVKGNVAVSLMQKETGIETVVYTDPQNALFALLSGEVNAIVYPQHVMLDIAKAINIENQIKFISEPVIEIKRAIAIKKGNEALAERLEYGINQLMASDQYQAIYLKWYGEKESFWTIARISWGVSSVLLVLVLMLLIMRYITIARLNRQLQQSIEEQQQAKKTLIEKEAELSQLIETLPLGLALCKMDGSLVQINQAYADIIGCSIEETLKLTYWEITPVKYVEEEKRQLDLLSTTGYYGPYIKEYIHKKGYTIPVQLTGNLIQRGEQQYIWSVAENISERLKSEDAIRRSQKMDAIGQLTGGIAHDFNNMLNVILGFSELLRDKLSGNEPKLIKYCDEIINAGERARKLTSKLLDFSRKTPAFTEIIHINNLLHDMQHLLEKTLTARIKLEINMEEDLWLVELDKARLEDAILNICINAMHAMPEGGVLTLSTNNIHLIDSDTHNIDMSPGDYVLLLITDTGVGMDRQTQQKMFDPFFTTKGAEGTGLGMSQVYGFVQQSGGNIQVYSEPGQGTRIAIYIPRYLKSIAGKYEENTTDSVELPSGHETILVVDDEVALLDLTEEILTTHGYTVLRAENAEQALQILNSRPVDLLLSDVIMPGMNGYQLATEAEKLYPKLKIQMASGFSDEKHINSAKDALHQQRLQKPYSSAKLLVRIRQLLDMQK